MPVNPIPEGYHSVTPYLIVPQGEEALRFYAEALGAKELMRLMLPDGSNVAHAEMQIGDSRVMIAGACEGMEVPWPTGDQWPAVALHLYVEDIDKAFTQATAAGCKAEMPPTPMFWGDRMAKLRDPFGHVWSLAQHVEDVPEEEIPQRYADAMAGQ